MFILATKQNLFSHHPAGFVCFFPAFHLAAGGFFPQGMETFGEERGF